MNESTETTFTEITYVDVMNWLQLIGIVVLTTKLFFISGAILLSYNLWIKKMDQFKNATIGN